MTAVVLTRNDSARNMRRYYRLDVQPDLFSAWRFVREWGHIGRAGQTRSAPCHTPDAAAELERQRRRKERKGHVASSAGRDR
jgi:predicted DNA-binding WGR domain protein